MLAVVYVIALTLIAAAIAAVAQYVYKKGLKEFEFTAREILIIFGERNILLGLSLYIVSLVIYLFALSNAPLISFVYPIFASTFIFVLLLSKHVLKEITNPKRDLGIALIILGIIIISLTFPS